MDLIPLRADPEIQESFDTKLLLVVRWVRDGDVIRREERAGTEDDYWRLKAIYESAGKVLLD